jgi:hypothetical protein
VACAEELSVMAALQDAVSESENDGREVAEIVPKRLLAEVDIEALGAMLEEPLLAVAEFDLVAEEECDLVSTGSAVTIEVTVVEDDDDTDAVDDNDGDGVAEGERAPERLALDDTESVETTVGETRGRIVRVPVK